MKLKFFCSLVVLGALFISNVQAQQTAKQTPSGIGYLEYLPQGYSGNSNKYPIVISLHGIKEKGNTLSDVGRVANVGLPKYVKYGAQYSFILISPQLKSTMGRWTGDYIMQVINHVKTYLRVDASRIYLTGLSLGGGGVWSVATAYPNVFASILPICSGYNVTSSASKLAAVDMPVWTFHGDKDYVVSHNVSVAMVNAINNCTPKPSPLAKITIFPGMGHVIWDKVYKNTDALNWMLSYRKGSTTTENTTTDTAPVASAGADKTLTLPTNSTTIYGSGTDNGGSIASYVWTKKSGSTASLSGTTTKSLSVSNLVAGTYVFTLTVKDNTGKTDTDDVSVIVKSSTTNTAPVANAGTDKTLTLPSNSLTIYGSGTDSNGSIASYAWSKKSGSTATLSGAATKDLKVSGLVAGTYVFTLTVKDNNGATDTDDVSVIVKSSTTTSTTNAAPVANAGSDRRIALPTSSTAVQGYGSDSDGSIASYSWTKVSGPYAAAAGTSTSLLKLSGMVAGTYTYRLTVKDSKGATDTDDITIIVDSPPTVNAGADKTVSLPIASLTLTASASDNGTIASYLWSKTSGPNLRMTNTTSKTVTLSGLYEGTYTIKVAVKDNTGLVTYDYVKVIVKSSTAYIESVSNDTQLAMNIEMPAALPVF